MSGSQDKKNMYLSTNGTIYFACYVHTFPLK